MNENKYKYDTSYYSKKYQVGSVHSTTDHGALEILGRMDDPKCDLYVVRFLSTGFVTKARTSGIKKGMVKDYYVPVLYKRGYMGSGAHSSKAGGKTTREYKLWTGMFYRCYSGDEVFKTYRGIDVDPRWFSFQVFCEDIKTLENYDAWSTGVGMSLDKDTYFDGTYSLTSCMFLTKADNSQESAIRNHSRKP